MNDYPNLIADVFHIVAFQHEFRIAFRDLL